jgi:hypothetical protein
MQSFVWRPTIINTFLQCPFKFFHLYLKPAKKGLPPVQDDNPAFQLGKIVHAVLEAGLKERSVEKAEEMAKKLRSLVPAEKEEDFELILPNALGFVESFLKRGDVLHYTVEKTYYFPEWNLQGTADLVVLTKDGRVEIIDHKTNKYPRVEGYIQRQLLLYGFFVLTNAKSKGLLDKVNGISAKVHFVRHGLVKEAYHNLPPKQVLTDGEKFLKEFIEKVKEQIGKWDPSPGWYCRFCPVKKKCSYFRPS